MHFFCPYCETNQTKLSKDSYSKKLIRALKHPEPQTVIWAANILGKLKLEDALPSLEELIKSNTDPFILVAAAKVFCKIGERNQLNRLKELLKNDINSFLIKDVLNKCK